MLYSNWLLNWLIWDIYVLPLADPVEGSAVWINCDWVHKTAVEKMKCGKAAGSVGIVTDMLKTSSEDKI